MQTMVPKCNVWMLVYDMLVINLICAYVVNTGQYRYVCAVFEVPDT